jgi:hypothetical protein
MSGSTIFLFSHSRTKLLNDMQSNKPVKFSNLPEWMIEDVAEYYIYLLKTNPILFEHSQRDEIVTFGMIMLYHFELIKNPYLKSKFVEVIIGFFTCRYYFTLRCHCIRLYKVILSDSWMMYFILIHFAKTTWLVTSSKSTSVSHTFSSNINRG